MVVLGRNQLTARAMSEADRLLHNILEGGDMVGRADDGRFVMVLAIDPRDFNQLLTFGAVEVESECGGDDEPFDCPPVSPCWFEEAAARFVGLPLQV